MTDEWLSTRLTAKKIGVSYEFLLDNRLTRFKAGYHYRSINPAAARPTFKWNPERCAKVLDDATKKSAKIELSQQPTAKGRGVQLPFLDEVKPYEIE